MTYILGGSGLRFERDGAVGRLTLARPAARNALTLSMWQGISEIADDIVADKKTRVLVISGDGDKAFSAGADIAEFPKTYQTAESTQTYNAAVRLAQAKVAALPLPVIAEIRGICFGGGCGLALHCDLRFAETGARFAITPARLGLAYSFADTARLVTAVGPARAKDILFSGRTLLADEALDIGLIDRIVAPDVLAKTVAEYAAALAGLSQISIRTAKQTVEAISAGATQQSDELQAAIEATFSGADFSEGYAAFLEKRKPDFD